MVKQILDDNGGVVKNINPVVLRQPVSTKSADFVLNAMEQTVQDGTGKKGRVPGYRVAGKTGTAEKINPETGLRWEGKYLVSFIGCAPVDDPQIVVYVVIDEPNVEDQSTGGYSMIISRKIMMEVLPYLNIPQTEEITDELLQELELTREDVENGRNATLKKNSSETTETDEYGNVISQSQTQETDEYGNVISQSQTQETDEYGNVTRSDSTTTQQTTAIEDQGGVSNPNVPAPPQDNGTSTDTTVSGGVTSEQLDLEGY